MGKIIREYIVGENQQKNYSFLFDKTSALHNVHICFYLERNAILVAEILICNVDINITIECIIRGEGADARIMGAYVLNKFQKSLITTKQHHAVADARSMLMMKGILHDNAQAEYHGMIRVEKEARGTYTSQENKNILLSNNARAVSVPSLEVLTHDVHCAHGSATGKIDEEQLFYAACRGMEKNVAQKLLVQAFFADLFEDEMLNKQINLSLNI